VDGFDHHCVYLNLCVGKRNYHLFFAFVTTVTTLISFQLFVTLWLLAHVNDSPYNDAVDSSRLSHPLAWLILLSVVSVIPALCLVGISTLQCFHCYLLFTAQSTYSFIIKRRALMEERRWQWEQRQRQRERELQQWGGGIGLPGAPLPPPRHSGPLIVLTERQRLEQAEWLKEQQRRAAAQQRSSAHRSERSSPPQPAPGERSRASSFIQLNSAGGGTKDDGEERRVESLPPQPSAVQSDSQVA